MLYIQNKAQEFLNQYPIESFGNKIKVIIPEIWFQESWNIAKSFVYLDIDIFPNLTPDYIY